MNFKASWVLDVVLKQTLNLQAADCRGNTEFYRLSADVQNIQHPETFPPHSRNTGDSTLPMIAQDRLNILHRAFRADVWLLRCPSFLWFLAWVFTVSELKPSAIGKHLVSRHFCLRSSLPWILLFFFSFTGVFVSIGCFNKCCSRNELSHNLEARKSGIKVLAGLCSCGNLWGQSSLLPSLWWFIFNLWCSSDYRSIASFDVFSVRLYIISAVPDCLCAPNFPFW